jgi:hypothetical protein
MKANIVFEDYTRLNLILKLIERINAQNYLEIGCDKNQIFRHINCQKKIGVDPYRGGNHLMTSDAYFLNFTEDMFDVIFIDGLHHYEQVTKDVNNALNRLNDHGYIIIHDLLPVFKDETSMPAPIASADSPYWLGDTWRLSFDLMGRSDITFKIVTIDCGCGVIIKTPQVPVEISHENNWEWYCNNLDKLPLTQYHEI